MSEPEVGSYRIVKRARDDKFCVEIRSVRHPPISGSGSTPHYFWDRYMKEYDTFALAEDFIRQWTKKDVVMANYSKTGSKL